MTTIHAPFIIPALATVYLLGVYLLLTLARGSSFRHHS